MNLVKSADDLKNIRYLRNEIAHEYCLADITTIFKPVLEYSAILLTIIQSVETFIKDNV